MPPRMLIRSFLNSDHLWNMVIIPCVAIIRIFQKIIFLLLKQHILHKHEIIFYELIF